MMFDTSPDSAPKRRTPIAFALYVPMVLLVVMLSARDARAQLGLAHAAPQESAQQATAPMVIQPPNGGHCGTLGGLWTRTPVPTCTVRGFSLRPGEQLVIRRGARLIVPVHFVNSGFIQLGDLNDSRPGGGELILGDGRRIAGAGANYGYIYVMPPHPAGGGSSGLSNYFVQFVNANTISNLYNANLGSGGILNNFGTIFNLSRIINVGFLYNGPRAQLLNRGQSGLLSNTRGIIENHGIIEGRVTGSCPGDCR